MNKECYVTLSQLLFLCFVPIAIAAGIADPRVAYVEVPAKKFCGEGVISSAEWPDGKRVCVYQKMPHAAAGIVTSSPHNADYLKRSY